MCAAGIASALGGSIFIAAFTGGFLFGALRRDTGLLVPQPLAAPDEVTFQTLESDYKIAPMDKLAIKVFKMEDLSGEYDVDLAGNLHREIVTIFAPAQRPPDRSGRVAASA